jgi:hypothetical protein
MHAVLFVSVIELLFSDCHGFSTQVAPLHQKRHVLSSAAYSRHLFARRPQQYTQDGVTILNLEVTETDGLYAACDFSETFGPQNERLTIDGERIFYRMGRVEKGRWISAKEKERPVPHFYQSNENDLVIDMNGYAWRTQEALRGKGLTRHDMVATQHLFRPLASHTNTTTEIQLPIPWNGPLNLPPRERGMGTNRKLRDDLQFGCEPDDERWLVYYTKLATYYWRFGNVNVPLEWEEDESLGRWVFKQRVLYRRLARNNYYQHEIQANGTFGRKVNPLSPWRIQMLYDLGFSFKINLTWHDRLVQLEQFKKRYGHVQVCQDDDFPSLNLWIQTQRTEYRRWKHDMRSSMTKRRFVLLDRLGLDWDPLASKWDARIQQVKDFKNEHGHVQVTKALNLELASWLIYVRSQYRIYQEMPWDSALTKDRIEELEQLGIDWEPLKSRWQQQYEALAKFYEENGHSVVPVKYPKDQSLSLWVQKQRRDYKTGTLSEENEAQLRRIDFVFDFYDAAFARGLEKLKMFQRENGNCRVPHSHPDQELVSFVKQQRRRYRRMLNGESSSMTDEWKRKLEKLGFEWRKRSDQWTENYEKLRSYRHEHGNCNVPSDYEHQSLYQFVSKQRMQYKRLQNGETNSLTPERIEKLESLGFVWNTNGARWMERYGELMRFQQENGHCNVPDKYSANTKLGSWVRNQRVQYRNLQSKKKSRMTPSRIALLEKIGFQWSVRKPAKQQ